MLKIFPSCERCNKDLPPGSVKALICSFECTFCAACATALGGKCPNCKGELVSRPRRSRSMLDKHPATAQRVYKSGK